MGWAGGGEREIRRKKRKLNWNWITVALTLLDDNQIRLELEFAWTRM